jgi:hypothetical protein
VVEFLNNYGVIPGVVELPLSPLPPLRRKPWSEVMGTPVGMAGVTNNERLRVKLDTFPSP